MPIQNWATLLYLSCLVVNMNCSGDVECTDYLILKEGENLSVNVSNSTPVDSISVTLITLNDFQQLITYERKPDDTKCNNKMTVTYMNNCINYYLNEKKLAIMDSVGDSDLRQEELVCVLDSDTTTFAIDVIDDDIFEGEEWFVLLINNNTDCAILLQIKDNDEVSFNWNQHQVSVFEDEGVVQNRISIVKQGNNDQNVTVRVQVIVRNDTDEAQRGYDYDLLKDSFIFSNETQNLSVPFQVYDGRIQLYPKHFYIAFSWDDRSLSISPNEVQIFILNRITFSDQPENITVELDGTAFFPCTRVIDGNGSTTLPHWKIRFSNGTLIMGGDNLPPNHLRCSTGLNVTVEDIELNFTAYTCYYFILVPYGGNTRPCPVYSSTGYLTINFPYTEFILSLPAGSKTYVRVGESIHFLINKQGGGDFTFNVTVNMDIIAPGVSDTYQEYFTFNELTDQHLATISIPHKYVFTTPAIVSIHIAEPIQVIEDGGNKQLTSNNGEAITITVYANVYFIGITTSKHSVNIAENKVEEFCVKTCEQDEATTDTTQSITLNIKLSQNPSNAGFKLDTDNVTLKSDPTQNNGICFNVTFYDVIISCEETATFNVSINWNGSPFEDYIMVKFCQQEISIMVTNGSCVNEPTVIAITVVIVVIMIMVLVVLAIVFIIRAYYRRCQRRNSTSKKTSIGADSHRSCYSIN